MKATSKHRGTSIARERALIRELRDRRQFAVEYLRAALDAAEEPRVLLLAWRQLALARGGLAKVAKAVGLRPRVEPAK